MVEVARAGEMVHVAGRSSYWVALFACVSRYVVVRKWLKDFLCMHLKEESPRSSRRTSSTYGKPASTANNASLPIWLAMK